MQNEYKRQDMKLVVYIYDIMIEQTKNWKRNSSSNENGIHKHTKYNCQNENREVRIWYQKKETQFQRVFGCWCIEEIEKSCQTIGFILQ